MDSSLAVLIGGTAAFAGAATTVNALRDTGFARAATIGAGVSAAVGASFLGLLTVAQWSLLPLPFLVALLAAATTYLTLRHDLTRSRAGLTAAAAALVVTAGFVLVSYLAMMALVGAAGLYLVLRTRLRATPALVTMGTAFAGLLASAGAVFYIGVSSM